jgi:hypothetical protein
MQLLSSKRRLPFGFTKRSFVYSLQTIYKSSVIYRKAGLAPNWAKREYPIDISSDSKVKNKDYINGSS